jgi:hypothetical protein
MVRTLALAALVTLFGAGASQAQYQDSAPPDEQGAPQYDTQRPYDGYDEELLGPPADQRYNDDQRYDDSYDSRGYSRPDVDVGIFANLSDGRWFFTANFGWVWRPYEATSWRPYSDGRWVWTSYGWTWVSYEPFGWATYHYGYWNCDSRLGWVWIPGNDWSACRVQFAYYDDYVCWAPLPPPGYSCPRPFTTAGFNIWFTIGASHFCDPYPARYCVRPSYNTGYAPRVAYKSPDRNYVQRYTNTTIRTSTVQFKNKTFVRGTNSFGAVSSPRIKSTRDAQPYVRNSRPYTQPQTRDTRAYAQDSRQHYKGSPQPKSYVDARALQQRPRDASVTRQYQPREMKRSYSRDAVRPMFETRQFSAQRDVVRNTGRSQRMERQAAPQRQAERQVAHGGGNGGQRDVAKSKGGNGRGNGKR